LNYAGSDYVTGVRSGALGCRSTAVRLQKQATDCRSLTARNPEKSCSGVTYKTSDGAAKTISPDEADALATAFMATASELERQTPLLEVRQLRVNADEAAIRALGFERTARDFEEWEHLSKEAQQEFYLKLADVALGTVLVGAKETVASVKSLNPWNAQKVIGRFKAAHLEDPKLFAAIRRLARKSAGSKANWIKDWQEVVSAIQRYKDTALVGAGVGVDHGHIDRKLVLEALASCLSWLLKDPVLELLVLDVQIAAAYVYGATAVIQVDKLMALAERDLKSLTSLKKRTEGDWQDLNSLLHALPRPCSLS
jgi:hypothetical protein